jgi:hypothetical protein
MSEREELTAEELCLAVMSGKRLQCRVIKESHGPVVWPNSAATYYKLRIHPDDTGGLLLTTLKEVADALAAGRQLEYRRKAHTVADLPRDRHYSQWSWQSLPKDTTQIALGRYEYRYAFDVQTREVYLCEDRYGVQHTVFQMPSGCKLLAKSLFVWKPAEVSTTE